jgi:glycerol-3-phosphate dehydrogenase (NAD(P)+)
MDVLGKRPVSILSGPSHAEEVAKGLPTSLALAGSDQNVNLEIQKLFNSETFRVYTNDDVMGVELAGALKNVIAIAAGINDGLGYGDNSKAALITRGLVEMTRYGVASGADAATFNGLAGLGDLIATCTSVHSRNRKVGERLGRGEKLADFLPTMPQIAEGIFTAPSIREQAMRRSIDLPIIEQVFQVLQNGKNPRLAVQDLMNRAPRKE